MQCEVLLILAIVVAELCSFFEEREVVKHLIYLQ